MSGDLPLLPPICLHGVDTLTLLLKVGPETFVNRQRLRNISFHKRIQKVQQRYSTFRFNAGGYTFENLNVERNNENEHPLP
jgi:hypothetical protein